MDTIEEYLRQNNSRFVEELCQYVRFPSVSAQAEHRADLLACGQWLRQHCERIGLTVELCETKGHPILLAKTPRSTKPKPHYLVYGHYDVQPPEPFELWKSPPFEARLENNRVYGRGASDNKGQHLAHLNAVEAYLKTETELPCDLTFLIEGEEEVGSKSLGQFLKQRKKELRAQAVVISDTGMPSLRHPALTCALRGLTALEVIVHGPNRDLHSGIFGGSVENPAIALARMLSRLHDSKGRVAVPGFYDEVVPLTRRDRQEMARLPFKEEEYRRFLGVPKLHGEKGYTPVEQRSARPTVEINGLTSGYQGEGSKTIIPAWARAKLTMRLVPNQKPDVIQKRVIDFLRSISPPTVRLEIEGGHGGEPYYVSPESPLAQAGLRALEKAFGAKPVLIREGGSIPIVVDFQKILRAPTLLLGLALPDDNAHSPNEKFDLEVFSRGMRMSALLWQELGSL